MIVRQRLSVIMIRPFRSWSAISPVTIAETGKLLTPVIMHRGIGGEMVGWVRGFKNYFHSFLLVI
jgi:hypothetical protein